ncbi:MAG: helix-turn-helix transcriptional regulator [Gammaproteobacteria bacterium]|nr:helix-turn-helix transcriptional regulator [Gammaproteobacteria bacterium]
MPSRRYGQACSVARFLDQLGHRWTLLIVRDLLVTPRRFKELLANAPSMGPNLLTARLKDLLEREIIEKLPGAGATRYALTDKGRALEPVVLAMAKWGLDYADFDPDEPGSSRPDLLVVAFRAAFHADRTTGVTESYEFHVDDITFFAALDDGDLTTALGPAENAAFVLTTDSKTFDRVGAGVMSMPDAIKASLVSVAGDRKAFERFLNFFG